MTDSFDTAPDPDDRPPHAAPPSPPAGATGTYFAPPPCAPEPSRRQRRAAGRTGRVVRWWLGIAALLFIGCVVCLAVGLNHVDFSPLHIVVDGDDVSNGFTISGISGGAKVLLATGAVMLALLMVLFVPLLVLLVFCVIALAVVAGIGLPLLALAIALAAVSSPLWLVGLVVWLIVRDRRPVPRPAPSARMAA